MVSFFFLFFCSKGAILIILAQKVVSLLILANYKLFNYQYSRAKSDVLNILLHNLLYSFLGRSFDDLDTIQDNERYQKQSSSLISFSNVTIIQKNIHFKMSSSQFQSISKMSSSQLQSWITLCVYMPFNYTKGIEFAIEAVYSIFWTYLHHKKKIQFQSYKEFL